MKKLIISVLIGALTFSLCACGSKENKSKTEGSSTTQTESSNNSEKSFGGLKAVPQFKVKDMNDKEVTNDIFKDKKITMINIWGTFCGPCIEEMPILQELYKEYENKGVNVVGIVADGESTEVQALQILKKKKVEFTNLIPDEKFKEQFVSKTKVVPVSILVNSKGEIIDTVTGSKDKNGYKKIIEKNLQEIK